MRGFDSCPVYAVMCNKMSFCPSPSAALCFISLGCLGSAWSGGGGVASRKGECGTQSCFLELGPQSFIPSVAGPAPPDMGALLKFQQITTTLCTCVYVCVSVCVSLCVYVCVCVCVSHFSHVRLFATLWTAAHQAPLSMGVLQARIQE